MYQVSLHVCRRPNVCVSTILAGIVVMSVVHSSISTNGEPEIPRIVQHVSNASVMDTQTPAFMILKSTKRGAP